MECIYSIIGIELFSLLGNVIYYVLFIIFFCSHFQVNESFVFVTTGPRSTFVHVVEFHMEGSKKKRECALGQFTRYEKKLGEALLNNADNRWALDKMYEELKERFKEAEKAHDSYVINLEDEEAAKAEDAWINNLTARFDKLELEVGEVIGSQLTYEKDQTPNGAEAASNVEPKGVSGDTGGGLKKIRDQSSAEMPSSVNQSFRHGKLSITQSSLADASSMPGYTDNLSTRINVDPPNPCIQDIHSPHHNPKLSGFRHADVKLRAEDSLQQDQMFGVPRIDDMKRREEATHDEMFPPNIDIPSSFSQNIRFPHQNPKLSGMRHSEVKSRADDCFQRNQMFRLPQFGDTRRREKPAHEERQNGGMFAQGNFFGARYGDTRVRPNGEVNQRLSNEVNRLGPTRAGSSSRGGAPVKFEKVSIGKFEGDIRRYPEWRHDFINFIEPRFESYELAFVLKCHLAEEVQEEVSNSLGDYNQMWRRLDKRYGNISRLIDTILYEVKNLSASHEKHDGILKMINVVEKAARDLGNLNQRFELYNATTISIIEQAMSLQMKHEWVRCIAKYDCNSQDKFESLLQFLGEWKDMLEYSDASIRGTQLYKDGATFHAAKPTSSGSDDNKVGNQRDDKPPPKTGQRKQKCWACNAEGKAGAHGVWVCPTFLEMSVKSRQDLVKVNDACQRCLEVGCPGAKEIKSCRRKFTCSLAGCGGEHNKYLHAKDGSTLHAARDLSTTGDAILPLQ